ncbi:putative amidase [Cyphellophora attinorum]|uniref:amidase n=1 Tax=Cyphellophora attinorum TaxID=1664694 RepID=A0A0N1NYL0_9EURO|nr:putative amidase [Phialophora attinorum]KPI35894.1 putative amidase [Phialophora attinorum]
MDSRSLPIIDAKPMIEGTADYEAARLPLFAAISSNIPEEWYLPQELIDNPPKDVSNIPTTCGLLSAEELEITEKHDATSLAEAIAARKYSAVTVVKAFIKRAAIAHQLVRCLTQFFPKDAVQQAAKLDEHLATTGETVGPLHGVPVSIKEHMAIAGHDSSFGEIASTFSDDEDCLMPQAIMHLDCSSHFGRTLNPYNIHLTCGGSSGGEGALIALKGSVLGVGSDIGGSIRAPAAFCGIYGYKPTSNILPMQGMLRGVMPAELNILAATGPMGRSLRDMDFMTRVVTEAKPFLDDPKMIPTVWRGLQEPIKRRLKVGIIENDGFIEPQPPVKRGIAWARKVLSDPKYSHIVELKEFRQYKAEEAFRKVSRMFVPDGGAGVIAAIEAGGEPVLPLTRTFLAGNSKMSNAVEVSDMRFERDTFRTEYAKAWNAQDVDVVLGPCHVGPAAAHDTARFWTYTGFWNFVDYPGLVFPTPIKAELGEKYAETYKPLSGECKAVKELWDAGDFEGAPVNLQINARRYHDNELFGALALLKDALSLS